MKESRRSHWEAFWEEKQEVREVYSNSDRVVRNLARVTDLRAKKVLEVGAGTGRDSFPLLDLGADVYQLDYSFNSLKIMKGIAEEEHRDVFIIGGDTFQLPFRDGSFDVVFHHGLLEHFRPQQAENLLRENIRVLKQGGFLLVDVPQRYHVYTVMKHILIAMNRWFAGWEREFSVPELKGLLRHLGLEVVQVYGEWMYPSLVYRVAREVLLKAGFRLPLYPTLGPFLTTLRRKIREALRDTPLVLYTSLAVGVIGRKQ